MWWPLYVFNLCSFIFLDFQLFIISMLGRLPICDICVASPSVSFWSLTYLLRHLPNCVICVTLCLSSVSPPYLCHLCRLPICVTLCVSHYVYHIMCIILCVSYYVYHICQLGQRSNIQRFKVYKLWQVLYSSWLCHSQKRLFGKH